jgi:hypothetical protein
MGAVAGILVALYLIKKRNNGQIWQALFKENVESGKKNSTKNFQGHLSREHLLQGTNQLICVMPFKLQITLPTKWRPADSH